MDAERLRQGLRAAWLFVVVCAGLLSIVGSGGGAGALGFPTCIGPFCDNGPPPPPVATVVVQPEYATALVGTSVSYAAKASDLAGSLSYQWRRSSNGGASFVDIPGATAATLTLPNVNLADDATLLRVEVRSTTGGFVQASAHLVVSRAPGLVFSDAEFQTAAWLLAPVEIAGQAALQVSTERVGSAGNPGAYRRMVFQVPAGAGSARVFYSLPTAVYEPQQLGAVYVIDYQEDCIALQSSDTLFTQSSLLIEQAGRRYLSNTNGSCVLTSWNPVASRSSLGVADFRIFDGPACRAGETCPDFSASAPPMRFGYWRIAFGTPGANIAHGIDNWKVTVWRR